MQPIGCLLNASSNNRLQMFRRAGVVAGIFLLFLLASALPAHAGLRVSPSRSVLQVKPRQTRTGSFFLENPGDAPLQVLVEPEDWEHGTTGVRKPVSWLTVKPATLLLPPGRQSTVRYTVRVPKGASGELRAQIFFTTEITGTTSLRSRLGTMLYVDIQGTEHVAGEITDAKVRYTASTPGVTVPDQLDVAIGIRNQGNVHLIPEGEVMVRDAVRRIIETIPLPAGWGLLPHEQDIYHATQHGVHLKPGAYSLEITIVCGKDLGSHVMLTKTLDIMVDKQGLLSSPTAPTSSP